MINELTAGFHMNIKLKTKAEMRSTYVTSTVYKFYSAF